MMSTREREGERAGSSSFLHRDAVPSDDDDDREDGGHMLSFPRESPAGYASSAATTPGPSLSSPLTLSYSNRSGLVACEIEEICSVQWLPRSSSSSTASEVRDEGENSPTMSSLPERFLENYSASRNCILDDSGVQSINRLNNSKGDESGKKGGVSSYFKRKSEKGKKTDGFITRMYMRFWGKKNKRINEGSIDRYLDHEMGPRRFTYKELANATNNFSSNLLLGRGGFGVVYRGSLKDVQMDVAIKRISKTSSQGEKEYISEIRALGQLRHRNLVQFIGWCHEHQELLLVYEFMPNGSLHDHLFSIQSSSHLDWKKRYHIVLGLATALLYLHNGWMQCVLHRDIKPSNVLLDSDFNARLTDFGLARLLDFDDDDASHVTTNVVGTMGYLDPEYIITGKLGKESDIYSFGIVVLEIACGRRSIMRNVELERERHLVEWVWNLHGMGMILAAADKRLNEQYNENEMENLLLVGLWCCHPEKGSRPDVNQVLSALRFDIQVPNLPLTRPVPVYSSITPYQGNSFSGSPISPSASQSTTDSFQLPELSTDHTQIIKKLPQTSIHIMHKHLQTSTSQYENINIMDTHPQASTSKCKDIQNMDPQTSTSEYKDNKILVCPIPADDEGKFKYPFTNSVPRTTLAHEEDQKAGVEVATAQETFDIGIPTNHTSVGPFQSYQLPIIKGLIASLIEILKSDPKFDEVMDSVRKFTSMLIMVGAPLDDWNSLAQYVLCTVKEIDNLKFRMEDAADPSAGILSFLLDEIDSCKQAIEDGTVMLVNSHQQLHCALQEHVSLSAKYTELQQQLILLQKQMKDAEDACFSVLEDVNMIETKKAWNEIRLESLRAAAASATQMLASEKEEHEGTILVLSESMLSKISSFSFNV